jgi:hypothetical protein
VPEVARPRTWLLRVGWRRHGLVDPSEVPGETRRRETYVTAARPTDASPGPARLGVRQRRTPSTS